VTAADLERDAAPTARRSAPIARISRSALRDNAALAARALPAGLPLVGDVRGDAWGHGAHVVAEALRHAGVERLRGDDITSPEAAVAGIATTAEPNVDPLTVYGLPGGDLAARPALRLSGEVLATKALRRGEGVSYGFTHRAFADTRIALITGGYAQGIVRGLGNSASVTIAGIPHPIVGRVAMDVCVIDIGGSAVTRGAEAVYLGDPARGEPGIADWITATGLGAAELIAVVGQRASREYVA